MIEDLLWVSNKLSSSSIPFLALSIDSLISLFFICEISALGCIILPNNTISWFLSTLILIGRGPRQVFKSSSLQMIERILPNSNVSDKFCLFEFRLNGFNELFGLFNLVICIKLFPGFFPGNAKLFAIILAITEPVL